LIKDRTAHFVYYRDGQFIYEIREQNIIAHDMESGIKTTYYTGLKFPVPLNDIGTAMLKVEDKAIYFMRWIRRHLEAINDDEQAMLFNELSEEAKECGVGLEK